MNADVCKLLTTTAISPVHTDSPSAARYYNLNGQKVSGTPLQRGIYVVRRGNSVQKMLVK